MMNTKNIQIIDNALRLDAPGYLHTLSVENIESASWNIAMNRLEIITKSGALYHYKGNGDSVTVYQQLSRLIRNRSWFRAMKQKFQNLIVIFKKEVS